MEEKITGILIDPESRAAGTVHIVDNLSELYRLLHCDLIDIVRRRIGGKRYLIICDDEGLWKEEPKISAIDVFGQVMLVGALLIVNDGADGSLASLGKEDINHIMGHIHLQGTRLHPEGWPMLHQVEY